MPTSWYAKHILRIQNGRRNHCVPIEGFAFCLQFMLIIFPNTLASPRLLDAEKQKSKFETDQNNQTPFRGPLRDPRESAKETPDRTTGSECFILQNGTKIKIQR